MFQDFAVREISRETHTDSPIPFLAKGALASNNAIELRNGERATLLRLDESFISRMLGLQDREASGNTIKRSRETLQTLFDRGDIAFGIVSQSGQLLAQATLRLNTELPAILSDKFNTAANVAVVGCVMVDPDYTGQGLAPHLISKCLSEAQDRGADYARACILVNPETGKTAAPASMHNFRDKFDFVAEARGQSPETIQKRIVDFMVLKLGN